MWFKEEIKAQRCIGHECRTWTKEERKGGKLYSMNLGRGTKRKGMGESSGESCIA